MYMHIVYTYICMYTERYVYLSAFVARQRVTFSQQGDTHSCFTERQAFLCNKETSVQRRKKPTSVDGTKEHTDKNYGNT